VDVEKYAPVEVPSPEADWDVIWPFAVSFNGYERYDGELSELEASVHAMWDRGRVLPDDLLELRSTLFFTQRQHHWWGWKPEGDRADYIRDLVRKIGDISGEWVPGPNDFEVATAWIDAMTETSDEEPTA
jgi:hypothetical protein